MNAYRILAKTTYGVGTNAETEQRYYFVKAPTHAKALETVQSCHGIRCDSGEPLPKIKYDIDEAQQIRPTDPTDDKIEIYSL